MEINFELKDVHHCTSHRLGDTIIWKCPVCTGYERRLNLITGEMVCIGKTEHLHTGSNDGQQNLTALTKYSHNN